jgi:hypothetical protein
MTRLIDFTGRRFSRLLVDGGPTMIKRRTYWMCVCDCGNRKSVEAHNLKMGRIRSCGCFLRQRAAQTKRTHGMTRTAEWRTWAKMKERCLVSSAVGFKHYGGRGITICERWLKFENFFLDLGEKPSPSHSLGRIDNNGNYEPLNCRWETWAQQQNNRRNNLLLTKGGETATLQQWARKLGVRRETIKRRLELGWGEERALCTPPRKQKNSRGAWLA